MVEKEELNDGRSREDLERGKTEVKGERKLKCDAMEEGNMSAGNGLVPRWQSA